LGRALQTTASISMILNQESYHRIKKQEARITKK